MLFKFFFNRTRQVQQSVDHGGEKPYVWMDTQNAYSKCALFRDLDAAKAYAQLHTTTPLVWEHTPGWGFHTAVVGDTEFQISEDSDVLEPTEPMPIPDDFRSTERDRD